MGRAMGICFAEYGADLVLADVDTAGMDDAAATIEALGRKAGRRVRRLDPSRSTGLYDTLEAS